MMQSDDQLVLWSKFYHVSKESSVSLEMPTSHFRRAARMLTVISVWTLEKVLAEKVFRGFRSSPCPVSRQVKSLQRLLPGKNIDSVFHDILAPILVHMLAPRNFSNPPWSWRVVETLHLISSE